MLPTQSNTQPANISDSVAPYQSAGKPGRPKTLASPALHLGSSSMRSETVSLTEGADAVALYAVGVCLSRAEIMAWFPASPF